MAFTITGSTSITGSWTADSSGPTPPTPPVPITATAGATTTVRAIQNQAITSFSPFSSVTNGITPYYYYVSSGTLPAGITINSSTGLVSGTPTALYSSANVKFSVVDAYSTLATTTSTVSFTVNAALSATAGATTTVSAIRNVAITSFNPFSSVTGGYTPYVYSVSSGTLPAGVTINSSTGLVSGTPNALYTSANVVFKVTDALGTIASTTATVNFTVNAAITATAGATSSVTGIRPVAITSFNPFASVSGGYGPYTYFTSSGTLPSGITLNASTGLVSGTPTAAQSASSVVFSVRDSQNTTAATTVTVSFTITQTTATAGTTNGVTATINVAITSFSPFSSVSGGTSPYTYSVQSGTLPSGITLNTSTGLVSGTPNATYSTANVTFTVVDANGIAATTTKTVSFTVRLTTYTVQYLIVGGGGAGGGAPGGGGGGAGAFVPGSTCLTRGTSYPITVGGPGTPGGTAGASQFRGISAPGGGRGQFSVPATTGAGGGGALTAGALATGSPGIGVIGTYGYPGGPGNPIGTSSGGGGGSGGAGGAGFGTAPSPQGGAGGTGQLWPYTGPTVRYAGGGGGSGLNPGPATWGGAGGGPGKGRGCDSPFKGGGGGGSTTCQGGGYGGAGIVILVFPNADYPGSAPGATVTFPSITPGTTMLTYTTPGGPTSTCAPSTFTYTA